MVAFCQVLHSLSPKIYEVFRKNICGYNPRTLRRKATQSRATSTIFDICEALIKHRVSLWIDGLKSKELFACTRPKKVWILSVAADATKIPGKVEFCEPYVVWVGGIYPDHIVPQATFDPDLFVSATLAHEIKVGLVTVQDVPNLLSPMNIIAARPQATNENSDEFNRSLLECCSHRGDCHVASISFDGLSTEIEFIVNQLVSFTDGRTNSVGSVDPNHTAKSLRSQLVLGAQECTTGNCVFDTGLFKLGLVSADLYCVRDFASDGTVLELTSLNTIDKLCAQLGKEQSNTILGTAATLYFLRMFLKAWNSDGFPCRTRVTMLWSAVMWFNNMKGIHKITLHNLTASCLAEFFLCVQRGIRKMRLCTVEPLEHQFGTARSHKREFTGRDWANIHTHFQVRLQHYDK
jgi:hypothetical protein